MSLKAAGLAGMVGGILLALVAVGWEILGYNREDVAATDPVAYAISGVLHLIGFALLFVMLLGALSVGREGAFNRPARWLFYATMATLVLMAIGWLISTVVPTAEIAALPAGIGFIGIILLSFPLGIALWRSSGASGLSAGLLLLAVPVMLFGGFGGEALGIALPIAAVEVPLFLGLAALGHDLRRARGAQRHIPRETPS